VLRVLTARWLGLPPEAGALFALAAGSFGVLGHEHARPVLSAWALR
jgi:probable phosphoglycerate mutase